MMLFVFKNTNTLLHGRRGKQLSSNFSLFDMYSAGRIGSLRSCIVFLVLLPRCHFILLAFHLAPQSRSAPRPISSTSKTCWTPAPQEIGATTKATKIQENHADDNVVLPIEEVKPPRINQNQLLVHWRGEGIEGSNLQFRHDEFRGALSAITGTASGGQPEGEEDSGNNVVFRNALEYAGNSAMSSAKIDSYNQAMQFVEWDGGAAGAAAGGVSEEACIQAVQRCSLIHALYQVVAESTESYDDLAAKAMTNGGFDNMANSKNTSWCVRVRRYGENENFSKERRYGHRARSMALERQALQALKPLLLTFAGSVDLVAPDCKIYIFDGLGAASNKMVLARRIASGPRVSMLDPNTRHCVTNTPLGPVAAFIMNNVARIRPHARILDPFAGSCAILLAAAMIEPTAQTVGIELAHNGLVNRDDILTDFATRNLTLPAALLHGDCRDARIRKQAIEAVGRNRNEPFDCIVTDPPYGIRESKGGSESRPIDALLQMIAHDNQDHSTGTPRLLKKGGRLVVFLPQSEEESLLEDVLPTESQLREAGLRCERMSEQPLNDKLSRWLVSYKCIK